MRKGRRLLWPVAKNQNPLRHLALQNRTTCLKSWVCQTPDVYPIIVRVTPNTVFKQSWSGRNSDKCVLESQSLCNKRPSLLLFASHVTFDVCIHIQTLKLMVEGNS